MLNLRYMIYDSLSKTTLETKALKGKSKDVKL